MNPPFSQYTITAEPEDLRARFRIDVPEFYKKRYNAAPAQLLPVILAEQPEGLSFFYWGLFPGLNRNKTVSEKVITRRAEDMLIKPLYRKILGSHRCLIPADGFYIWKPLTRKAMVPYRVTFPSMGLVSFSAIWEEFEDDLGVQQHTFSVITVPAQGKSAELYERMPLVLSPASEERWLDLRTSESEIRRILEVTEIPPSDYYSVTPAIEDTSKDSPLMILPAPPADQFGNLTLFD